VFWREEINEGSRELIPTMAEQITLGIRIHETLSAA